MNSSVSKLPANDQANHIQNLVDLSFGSGKYSVDKVIGTGAYGVVASATVVGSQQEVAIKYLVTEVLKQPFLAHRILREILMMAFFRAHPNIMGLLDIAVVPPPNHDFTGLFIVMEKMDMDIKTLLKSQQSLTEEHIQLLVYQIVCGLDYVHRANVVHRDITPANVLCNKSCEVKICDFGLARSMGHNKPDMTDYVTMRFYRAPELVMEEEKYTGKVDIWGVGCILAELLSPTRKVLFPGRDRVSQLCVILNIIGAPSESEMADIGSNTAREYIRKHLSNLKPVNFKEFLRAPNGTCPSPEAIDLLEKMLKFKPSERISATDAMKHPFLRNFTPLRMNSV